MIVSATEYFRKINEENGTSELLYARLNTEEQRRERAEQMNYLCQWIEVDDETAKRLKLREVADAKRIEAMLRERAEQPAG